MRKLLAWIVSVETKKQFVSAYRFSEPSSSACFEPAEVPTQRRRTEDDERILLDLL